MTTTPSAEATVCAECGFVYDDLDAGAIPAAIRSFARRYRAPLSRFLPGEDGDALLRRRPEAETWSALEYAAHIRDVFANYADWIALTLAENRPALEGPGPEELARLGNYNDDDPPAVADAIATNAERLAATVEAVPGDGWDRVGMRGDHERSVIFSARRAVHEGGHHLLDIGRGMRAVRELHKAERVDPEPR